MGNNGAKVLVRICIRVFVPYEDGAHTASSFHYGVIDGYVRAAWLLKIIPGDEIKAYAKERLSNPRA
ncbi:MAG: hypothetical protein GEU71_02145 [Actinobacteria bacterium]|nr:hypothetical protein [Actinomycetota bacterium]